MTGSTEAKVPGRRSQRISAYRTAVRRRRHRMPAQLHVLTRVPRVMGPLHAPEENAVVKGHGKKQRARKKAQSTGAPYTAAAAGMAHGHPKPDTDFVEGLLPYVDGWESHAALATNLLAA